MAFTSVALGYSLNLRLDSNFHEGLLPRAYADSEVGTVNTGATFDLTGYMHGGRAIISMSTGYPKLAKLPELSDDLAEPPSVAVPVSASSEVGGEAIAFNLEEYMMEVGRREADREPVPDG